MLELDPANKYIKILEGTSLPLAALTIYNTIMDWADSQEAMGYDVPMAAVGKAPLGGGVYTDSIFILQNGWKIKFWSGTYQAIIYGTLITDDETPRTVPPDSGNVEVVFQVSSQGTVIPDVAEWTPMEKNGIISNVNTIHAKTSPLPPDPASQSTVVAVMAKTDNLPVDPASQSLVDAKVDEKASDIGGAGFTKDTDSLKQIREYVDELESSLLHSLQVSLPKSKAQYLDHGE